MHKRKRFGRIFAIILLVVVIAAAGIFSYRTADRNSHATATTGLQNPSTGAFDYYVLALSWSPHYCLSTPDDAQQCSPGRKLGFVLHGLWPQHEKGYPEKCSHKSLPAHVKPTVKNLYPNDRLIIHEWYVHGTCSGLKPEEYWGLSHTLFKRVVIPANYVQPARPFKTTYLALTEAFKSANPSINPESMAVKCSSNGKFLQEIYVCFDKAGQPRACSQDIVNRTTKSCRRSHFLVRNVR